MTANQIVAANITRWRAADGMTQQQLGELVGWSAADTSARERSVDPAARQRRFDAEELLALAEALRVPVIALLMPPEEGVNEITAGPVIYGPAELMSVLFPEPDPAAPVSPAYEDTYITLVNRYLDKARADLLISYLREATTAERQDMLRTELSRHAGSMEDALAFLRGLLESIPGPDGEEQ
jgi:transcriptional regulator with XRE-family HTH domain